MCENYQKKMAEYQLREAAGKYWLLHMTQQGVPYEKPIQLNSVGAELWRLFLVGKTAGQAAEILSGKYQIPAGELNADVELFCGQLKKYGIFIEG